MDEFLKRIIFLSYLTNYNIPAIYRSLGASLGNTAKKQALVGYDELAMLAFEGKNLSLDKLSTLKQEIDKALESTEQAINRLKYLNINAITFIDKNYPAMLHDLADKPPVIYVKGRLLKRKKLAAIVGSRTVSQNAERITNTIVDKLTEHSFGIVSGLALGIDTIAHTRTLQRQGYTIAVMPIALDKVYPSDNYRLASEIIDKGGAVISEMIFGINRGKTSFVQRNRIQSGLSKMIIPIEMGIKSGTMHTIDFTIRQKRELILLKIRTDVPEYEGIRFLIDKYTKHPSDNAYIINGVNNFVQYLTSKYGEGSVGIQMQMF